MNTVLSRRSALLASLGLATWLTGCLDSKPQFKSIDLTGADYARDFQLADHKGQQRTLADFKGQVVVVFFGFTQCPDVCPTAMARLAEVRRTLGTDGQRVQGLFVSLDPERDTPEVLQAYMVNFDPSFLALRPTLEQLPDVAKHFKMYYRKNEGKTAGSYTLDHGAGSYVFDPQGRVRLYVKQDMPAADLAQDLKLLLQGR